MYQTNLSTHRKFRTYKTSKATVWPPCSMFRHCEACMAVAIYFCSFFAAFASAFFVTSYMIGVAMKIDA